MSHHLGFRMQPPAQIPYDIFTNIIDQLASEHCYTELSKLSQTCHILLQPCRLHLFSSIYLGSHRSCRLTALITRDSAIQGYVTKLSYLTSNITEDLANALLLLNNVKSFDLRGEGRDPVKWTYLPEHIQRALMHLFCSPSIIHFSIYNFISFPTILLSTCSNLESLKMIHCRSFSPELCDTTLHTPPRLLSLDISRLDYDPLQALLDMKRQPDGLSILDLSCLESLFITVFNGQLFEEILRSTTKLHRLECQGISYHYLTSTISLSTIVCLVYGDMIPDHMIHALTIPLPTLQCLHLEWWAPYTIEQNFPSLIRLLKALAHPSNCIEELNLNIKFRYYKVDDLDWESLDPILSDRCGFGCLKTFTIQSSSASIDHQRVTVVFDEIKRTKFPRLSSAAKNHLDFKFVP